MDYHVHFFDAGRLAELEIIGDNTSVCSGTLSIKEQKAYAAKFRALAEELDPTPDPC